jgi:transcriptional regulator with XRE-family HTH domain
VLSGLSKWSNFIDLRIIVRFCQMNPGQRVAVTVRDRRRFLRLTQRDLSELSGVTLRGITILESGRGNPTLSQLSRVAEVLGLQVSLTGRLTDEQV